MNKETTAKTLKDFKPCLRKFDTDKINFEPILDRLDDRFYFLSLTVLSILFFRNYCLHDPTSNADLTYRAKIKFSVNDQHQNKNQCKNRC